MALRWKIYYLSKKINGEVSNYKYFIKSKSITEVTQDNLFDHFAFKKNQQGFNIQYFIHDGVLYKVKKEKQK